MNKALVFGVRASRSEYCQSHAIECKQGGKKLLVLNLSKAIDVVLSVLKSLLGGNRISSTWKT